jgi:hypothetical protein
VSNSLIPASVGGDGLAATSLRRPANMLHFGDAVVLVRLWEDAQNPVQHVPLEDVLTLLQGLVALKLEAAPTHPGLQRRARHDDLVDHAVILGLTATAATRAGVP